MLERAVCLHMRYSHVTSPRIGLERFLFHIACDVMNRMIEIRIADNVSR